jgi:hypothetical protein
MAQDLKQYLIEAYSVNHYSYLTSYKKQNFIQIDDQDDNDNIEEFCNIFLTFKGRKNFELELSGKIPITQDIADLAEIYHGTIDLVSNRICLTLNVKQIEAVSDLILLIRKTSTLGHLVGNSNWHHISARTISSLNRFIRIIKEYISLKQSELA